jgi:hypothetical protein
MKDKLISLIAQTCDWHKVVNDEYMGECEDRIYKLEQLLPSGSGIDAGCKIDVEKSSSNKVVINFSWHHLDENGYYDGWTDHKLIVKPKLSGDFDLTITGRDKGYIKDYLYDLFDTELKSICEI